jgi:AcrR family transcriptional regulator
MTSRIASPRPNQKARTRKDLLQAASRLLGQGRKPSLEEVAAEALVSRATAYRYFPDVDALLVEAALDVAAPDPARLFEGLAIDDPIARLEKADHALNEMILANEAGLRMMLAYTLQRPAKKDGDLSRTLPVRQNRRTPLIEAALAPARSKLRPATFRTLTRALAFIFGTEAMVVTRDVLQLSDSEALQVRRWAIRALVDAARRE